MINDLKDYYKKSMNNFTKLNLPELEKILKHFANTKKIIYLCDICNKNEYESLQILRFENELIIFIFFISLE